MTFHGRRRRKLSPFEKARRAEDSFARALRRIARHIGDITSAFDPLGPEQSAQLQASLRRYAETLTPWANATAERMVQEVAQRDWQAW